MTNENSTVPSIKAYLTFAKHNLDMDSILWSEVSKFELLEPRDIALVENKVKLLTPITLSNSQVWWWWQFGQHYIILIFL